jgi:hypothetical protein
MNFRLPRLVGYSSGQRGQTVNLLGFALRRFESFSYHQRSLRKSAKLTRWSRQPPGVGDAGYNGSSHPRSRRVL